MSAAAPRTALIAVDVQGDFLPGGSLAVLDGLAVVESLLRAAAGVDMVVATRDWHPPDHVSFAARGGPWPVHCVAGTAGAALHPEIDRVAGVVVSKGSNPDVEAYSGFDGAPLAALLRGAGVQRLLVGGLATDYCVRATVLHALSERFAVTVLCDAVRAVDVRSGDGDRALQQMREAGALLTGT
ncbi:MAG TPA: isochorismatase family protein [Candidatus Angelobacter sp.]|jgi:nicotinamidase/pyrazinamidase|nr:isochorismatase family protein [Candidatus Angelobacter sp.]